MKSMQAALILGVCILLASCDDSATRPTAGPTFDAAATALTPVAGGEAILPSLSGPSGIGTQQAATGGRASGHIDTETFFGSLEQYSFIALSTGTFPDAKGELQWKATNVGNTFEMHADVDCLAITGNQAWVSGPAERFTVNGEPQPVGFDVQIQVIDNGEGSKSPPDEGSALFFSAPQGCQFRPFLLPTPSERGNVQVREK